jgi:uncharacterized protein (DUF2461 family)
MDAKGLPVHSRDDTLTGMPRGFAQYRDDDRLADVLRWQHYLVGRDVDDAALTDPSFAESVVDLGRDAMPLLEYVWDAAE